MTQVFQGSGFTPGQVRADRVLEEALDHGPDPLHLAHVFAISRAAAVRYAIHAEDLMRLSAEVRSTSATDHALAWLCASA